MVCTARRPVCKTAIVSLCISRKLLDLHAPENVHEDLVGHDVNKPSASSSDAFARRWRGRKRHRGGAKSGAWRQTRLHGV